MPERLSAWEVPLTPADLIEHSLPKPSVIRVGKLFTMHGELVTGRFGRVTETKLSEVLARLRALFGD